MEAQLNLIKSWLGTGSINLFGLPMSGKDTQGQHLAADLNAKFLSSGDIIREKEAETRNFYTRGGDLAPQNVYFDWVLPYFSREDLAGFPLILSMIGRWSGEEEITCATLKASGHETKAVVLLNVSEADVLDRFTAAQILNDRGERFDDSDAKVFENRLNEFRTKVAPVLQYYKTRGLLIEVNGDQTRDLVYQELVSKLAEFATNHPAPQDAS